MQDCSLKKKDQVKSLVFFLCDTLKFNFFNPCWHYTFTAYIEDVGVEQALQDEWDSLQDGLQEDYAFRRWKMTAAEKKKYMKEVEQYE